MKNLIIQLICYGCIGFVIEVVFTSISSLIKGDLSATGKTYGIMFFVYAFAGYVMMSVKTGLEWPWWSKTIVYTPLIYGIEATSGVIIKKITNFLQKHIKGTYGSGIPWNYGHSWITPGGLVNFKYIFWWGILGCFFDPISDVILSFSIFFW